MVRPTQHLSRILSPALRVRSRAHASLRVAPRTRLMSSHASHGTGSDEKLWRVRGLLMLWWDD